MKIQVAGAAGMLGRQVCLAAEERGHEVLPVLSESRIHDLNAIDIKGDVVINCAGIVKQRSESKINFIKSNALGPHRLAEICSDAGARLVHVSTDCVFGLMNGPHTEASIPTPEDFYDVSKLLGEVIYGGHLTVRCSFVGHGAWGLVHDILAGAKIRASGKLVWNGMTARETALRLVMLAEMKVEGLYHLHGPEVTDRYSLVMALGQALEVDVLVERDDHYWRDRRLESDRTSIVLPAPPSLRDQFAVLAKER